MTAITAFRCLAVETATELAGVALSVGDTVIFREFRDLRAPSRLVYEWLHELLADADMGPGDLDCVAFGAGPGSFTGVRVAAAVAQALAYGASIPVCRVSTLAALAAAAMRQHAADRVLACLDARMNQVYLGGYVRDPATGVVAVVADRLGAPHTLHLERTGRFFAAGPGWSACPGLARMLGEQITAIDTDVLPSARDVLALARLQFAAGNTVSAAQALPNYLRDQVTTAFPGRGSPV